MFYVTQIKDSICQDINDTRNHIISEEQKIAELTGDLHAEVVAPIEERRNRQSMRQTKLAPTWPLQLQLTPEPLQDMKNASEEQQGTTISDGIVNSPAMEATKV